MAGYTPLDKKNPQVSIVSGVQTGKEIANVGLTAGGSIQLRIDARLSDVTVVGSINLKLQHAVTGSDVYTDLVGANATVSVTADGIYSMTQLYTRTADMPNLPLRKQLRVVAVLTNAGDTLTVDNVYVSMPL
jgi:hypothetical protein